MITRRNLVLAGVGALPLFGAADFWNKKKPSEWSEKEIQTLLTKSPWAKDASVEFDMQGMEGGRGGGMGGPGGGMGGPPGGGMGGPPGGGMGGPPGGGMGGQGGMGGPPGGGMGGGNMPEMHVRIRWESAMPIRAASKTEAAEQAANTYVISLSGMPAMGGRRRRSEQTQDEGGGQGRPDPAAMQARMKDATRLERKGKDPIAPVRVEMKENEESRETWFYFEGGGQPIDLADKEVTFVTRLGPMRIRAKFTLKDMVYQGKLEL
jgi:hypothetical protein